MKEVKYALCRVNPGRRQDAMFRPSVSSAVMAWEAQHARETSVGAELTWLGLAGAQCRTWPAERGITPQLPAAPTGWHMQSKDSQQDVVGKREQQHEWGGRVAGIQQDMNSWPTCQWHTP